MSLRYFSDPCVPAEITDTLRQHGHHVTLLREVLPIRSPDPAVIAKAQELRARQTVLAGSSPGPNQVRHPLMKPERKIV